LFDHVCNWPRSYLPVGAFSLPLYSRGVYSSRRIAQGCEERVDFMAVTAMNQPDFRTIANFRRRHLKALSDKSHRTSFSSPE